MKITVPRDHTHAGVFYPAGSQVDLSESEIAWLMQAERTTREKLVAEAPQPLPPTSVVEAESPLHGNDETPTDSLEDESE